MIDGLKIAKNSSSFTTLQHIYFIHPHHDQILQSSLSVPTPSMPLLTLFLLALNHSMKSSHDYQHQII